MVKRTILSNLLFQNSGDGVYRELQVINKANEKIKIKIKPVFLSNMFLNFLWPMRICNAIKKSTAEKDKTVKSRIRYFPNRDFIIPALTNKANKYAILIYFMLNEIAMGKLLEVFNKEALLLMGFFKFS